MKYIFKKWIKWDKHGTFWAFFRIPITIIIPTITALIPKIIMESIEKNVALEQFMFNLLSISFLSVFFCWLDPVLEEKLDAFQQNISMHYAVEAFEKLLSMDYENLESYEGRLKFERCKKFAFEGSRSDGAWAIVRLTGLCTSLLGIFTYSIILLSVSPVLIIWIIIICFAEFLIYQLINKIAIKTENEMSNNELKFSYFFRVATEPTAGKDIRLANAKEWLLWYLSKATASYTKIMNWYTCETTKLTALQAFCALARDGATFLFLVFGITNEKIELSDFLFYFNLVTGFSNWINGISGHIASLNRISIESEKYQEFINMPDKTNSQCLKIPFDSVEKIEFQNVSFSYNSQKPVINNLSFVINKGEKLAIVGENGAGKTTLIKLLCGLYSPTSGRILINDMDISQFEKESYFKLFSAIFQDYTLLPSSILANICMEDDGDIKRIYELLSQIGLVKKINSLKDGIDTKLIKKIDSDSTELSGGETQKLLIARALYKKSSVLILDEPTSSLDPIAEEMLYRQYDSLANDKISFYISHRLNSTRFCNRIFYMKDGEICEEGTHNELINMHGEYWNMYKLQGLYYQGGCL